MTERIPTQAQLDRPDPGTLLWAYAHGVFPMADPRTGEMEWFCPDPRAIFPLDAFHVPTSVTRVIRSGRFEMRTDTAFEAVMRACGAPRPDDDQTWIDERLIESYVGLHEMGHAHSVEAWHNDHLVGGLYGVHLGAAFFGESMFVRPEIGGTDASKVSLAWLVDHLNARGFTLLDTQFWTPHLAKFGCTEIPRGAYLRRLATALRRDPGWG